MSFSKNEFEYNLSKFIPFRDKEVCKTVRMIKKEEICKHTNSNFRISIIEDYGELQLDFALDIVYMIKKTLEEGKKLVILLPARVPKYAASIINTLGISCRHVHTFNMDEYADEEGNSAPASWPYSFQKLLTDTFFSKIDESLRPKEEQIHFISSRNMHDYGKLIEDLGGADVSYSQVGWNGHLAFFEPEVGLEFGDDLEGFKKAGPRLVELSPITVMQNSIMVTKCGDWSYHPPKAVTVGPAQFVGCKRNSFRQYGYRGIGTPWFGFIVRLVAHGPITPLVPSSILQTLNTDFKILGAIADNCDSLI